MRKHINSATEQYQDEYTDNWVLDDTPTEGSFNAVTSDGVAKAIAEGGGSSYTAGDGIDISEGEISAKVDGSTIQVNADGELEAIGGGGSSYTAGDGISISNSKIKVELARDMGLGFEPSTQTTFTADYQGYDLGQWGYMGIGPLHKTADGRYYQLDFRHTGNNYLAWNVNSGNEYYLFAYDPQDSTKYAICGVPYYADINYSSVVGIGWYGDGQYEHLYTADQANWDFSGGLDPNDLDNAAFGIFFPNTSGSSPMGTDFAAVDASLLRNIGYSTTTVNPDTGKLQVKTHENSGIQVNADGVAVKVDISTIRVNEYGKLSVTKPVPSVNLSTDVGKFLQVQSGGSLGWTSQSASGAYIVDFTDFSNWSASKKAEIARAVSMNAATGVVIGKVPGINQAEQNSFVYLVGPAYYGPNDFDFLFTAPFWHIDWTTFASTYGIHRVSWRSNQSIEFENELVSGTFSPFTP